MRQFWAEIGRPLDWERKLILFLGISLLLTVAGPFGTYEDLQFWARLSFWLIIMAGVGFFMHVSMATAIASRHLGRMGHFSRIALGALVAGLPGAAVVIFVHLIFRPPAISFDAMPMIWMQVSLIGLPIGVVEFYPRQRAKTALKVPRQTRLHQRLPFELSSADILSLTMQDHYVEVSTHLGKALILMRFSDAMAELDGVEGQQIHRSHWVSQDQINDIERVGHRKFVRLKDGRKLPLSNSYADKLADL